MAGETLLKNRYRLIAQQGSGGMAVIYRARDLSLDRDVAIKILRPSLTNEVSFITRFNNEARAIANLPHPNIVTVHDVGTEGAPPQVTYFIVMEFVRGSDLKKVIKTENQIPVERALKFAVQVCDGIGYAHRARIVHADVKPQNILVTPDDLVKVTDFGIAQALTDTQPQQRESVVWGSPHYFAPEQAKGEKPTAASDVYSIGIVLFEMLTGRLPYLGNSQQELAMAHIKEPVPQAMQFAPGVGDQLNRVIERAMSKDPVQRFRDADALGNALRHLQSRSGAVTLNTAPPATVPSSAAPPQTVPGAAVPPATIPKAPAVSGPSVPPPPRPAPTVPPTLPSTPAVEVTQRAPLAPEAPPAPRGNPGYSPARPEVPLVDNRAAQPRYPNAAGAATNSAPYGGQTVYDPNPAYAPPPSDLAASQQYRPPMRAEEAPSVMDTVTVVLAGLALLAVACLIPLYIAVAQAYAGG